LLNRLGVDASQIDHLLFNYGLERWQPPPGIRDDVQKTVTEPLLGALRKAQERDIGQWFGANNRWIANAPDAHPCTCCTALILFVRAGYLQVLMSSFCDL
jgi:hypothetical protein